MRKSRTVVRDVDVKVSDKTGLNPADIFSSLEKMDIPVPSWAVMMFIFSKEEKKVVDVSFFEDTKEFFLWYSKVLIRSAGSVDLTSASFAKEGDSWKLFVPPTLIGVNLRTKLRF